MTKWPRWLFSMPMIISLLAAFFVPSDPSHAAWWDQVPAFFALFGFCGCLLILVFVKALGALLLKKEDYYDAD